MQQVLTTMLETASNPSPLPDINSGVSSIPGVRVTQRRLSQREASNLLDELRSTPRILGYSVKDLLAFSDVLVAEVTDSPDSPAGIFAGACLSKDLLFGWTDIALLYILPDFRSRGVSTLLFKTAYENAHKRGRHIFTMSRTPHVIHLMEELGMERYIPPFKSPLAVQLQSKLHLMRFLRWRDAAQNGGTPKSDAYEFVSGLKRFSKD